MDIIDKYKKIYKDKGYIRYMREYVGHNPILSCACGVIIENDKCEILLQKRKDNGCWAIIGGAMEFGESIEETIRREVKEESNLSLGDLELFHVYSGRDFIIEYPNGDICFGPCIIYRTKEYKGDIVNQEDEVLEHKFFNKNKLPNNINEFDKKIIYDWAK